MNEPTTVNWEGARDRGTKINFGHLAGKNLIFFRDEEPRSIPDSNQRKLCRDVFDDAIAYHNDGWITPHEAFRRWKIARKAWRSRRWRNQLSLFPSVTKTK